MNEWKQESNQNINNLEKARMLRQEAVLLEEKERVKSGLVYLMNLSEDDYYSRYLEQMLKDLESGKATPAQVEKEAQRSYGRYRQKMSQISTNGTAQTVRAPVVVRKEKPRSESQNAEDENKPRKNTMEFKIGMHVFSVIGAIFLLASFMILSFNFFGRIEAMISTLIISVGGVFLSWKKDSTAIRIFGLLGCYICLFPLHGFESELDFLVLAGMLLIVNGISIFFQNQKNQTVINVVHILITVFCTSMLTSIAWSKDLSSVYLAFYVVTSFLFVNVLSLKRCMGKEESFFPVCCIVNVIFLILLFLTGNLGPGISKPEMALFMHLTVEALMLVVCLVTFLLWEKTDSKRWAQLYYAVAVLLLLGSFSQYPLEILLSGLLAFLPVKLAAGYKENIVLDCLVTAWIGLLCYRLADSWFCWVLAGALLLSIVRVKNMYIYHELVITISLLMTWGIRYRDFIRIRFALDTGWFYLVSAAVLLLLFLLFNHLPWLGKKEQRGYNICSVIIMTFYYLGVWFSHSYIFSSAMMVLGAVTILLVLRPKYGMEIRGKSLILAGFLVWFSLTGHYESPVIVSILLMVIALGCVGAGFRMRSRAERICGLTMAVFVCLKLVLYDFREVEVIYRVLVFFVVGIMALMISYIYVRLEKNMELQGAAADAVELEHSNEEQAKN